MSKLTVDDRLARLLDADALARVVPQLPPETLHRVIRHRGLDASGELVASATPAQLAALLDLDLWRHARPGSDEVFDVNRFGEWLEVLVAAGDSVAARTVAALDTNLVVAGLSRYVRVLDPGIFEPIAQSDDEPVQRYQAMREGDAIHAGEARDSPGYRLECEVGGYIVRARRADMWDAIVALLVALDVDHQDAFHTVMRGCRRLSNSRPETGGPDDLLMDPEQHLHDLTIEREDRRSQQGYATPAAARAFLEMARKLNPTRDLNPIVAAYFRAMDEALEATPLTSAASHSSEAHVTMVELLVEAGVMPARPRALLEAADGGPPAPGLVHLRRLMAYVRDSNEASYFMRHREVAFLANTLLAGCSVQSRPFTPQEASDAAAAICNLGLEYRTAPPPDSWLINHDLVTAFEVGWSVLHREVSLFATDQLIAALSEIDCIDREIQRGLVALRRRLVSERDAGTPWRAREAAETLAMLDMTPWIGVLGLLDECPVLPAALTAVVEGRTSTVSPTAFDFISTAAQIGYVRAFMRKLPDVLSR